MTADRPLPELHVPDRSIPVPGHLSSEAAGVLGMGRMDLFPFPAQDDIDGWRSMVAAPGSNRPVSADARAPCSASEASRVCASTSSASAARVNQCNAVGSDDGTPRPER